MVFMRINVLGASIHDKKKKQVEAYDFLQFTNRLFNCSFPWSAAKQYTYAFNYIPRLHKLDEHLCFLFPVPFSQPVQPVLSSLGLGQTGEGTY